MNRIAAVAMAFAVVMSGLSLITLPRTAEAATEYAVNESFEGAFPPTGWTETDAAGVLYVSSTQAYDGTYSMRWYDTGVEVAYIMHTMPDDYQYYNVSLWFYATGNAKSMRLLGVLDASLTNLYGPFLVWGGNGYEDNDLQAYDNGSYVMVKDEVSLNAWHQVKVNVTGDTYAVQFDSEAWVSGLNGVGNSSEMRVLDFGDKSSSTVYQLGYLYMDLIQVTTQSSLEITTSPVTGMVVDTAYTYDCEANEAGVTWSLSGNITGWASIGSANGTIYGTPTEKGWYAAEVKCQGSTETVWQNFTVTVVSAGEWGAIHTFDDVTDGTRDGATIEFDNGDELQLIDESVNDEMVVMLGELYYYAENDNSGAVARYVPSIPPETDWNISLELYPNRDDDYLDTITNCSRHEMIVYLVNDSTTMLGAKFAVGEPGEGYDIIAVWNGTAWNEVDSDIITVLPNYEGGTSPVYGERVYGEKFDRYILSFEQDASESEVRITIVEVWNGSHSVTHTAWYSVASLVTVPKLEFQVNVVHKDYSIYRVLNYWVIDNLGIRGTSVPYPFVEPRYEYIQKGDGAWLEVADHLGTASSAFTVKIDSASCSYNAGTSRYVQTTPSTSVGTVDWHKELAYEVRYGDFSTEGSVHVTVMPVPDGVAEVANWWNGWDWAAAFGTDDSTSATAATTVYSAYGVPGTSYLISASGSSDGIKASKSEIANHYPHDVGDMGYKQWGDAVSWANSAYSFLVNGYTFASVWDDPGYVGAGDKYLMMAFPGNWGNQQEKLALWEKGYRAAGYVANYNSPLSRNLWTVWCGPTMVEDRFAFYPWEPFQLMDFIRAVNTDNAISSYHWNDCFNVSAAGGVYSIYNHGTISQTAATFLTWVVDDKTNYTYENWLTTNGEIASYVNGRWTTDIVKDTTNSSAGKDVYAVSRQDPIADGYWRVPVTLRFNLTAMGVASITDINITEGAKVLKKSDSTLGNLSGARKTGIGYDIRGEWLYLSYFWNSSSVVTITYEESNEAPDAPTLSSPADGASLEPTLLVEFSWQFNDGDPGDSQSAYQLQISVSGEFTTTVTDTGKVSSSSTSVEEWTPEDEGTYYWRVKVWDSGDLESPWSSSRSFDVEIDRGLVIYELSTDLKNQRVSVLVRYSPGNTAAPGATIEYAGLTAYSNATGWAVFYLDSIATIEYASNATPLNDTLYDLGEGTPRQVLLEKVTVDPFEILAGGTISNGTWTDTERHMDFSTNASEVAVSVGDWGIPLRLEVDGETFIDWTFDAGLRVVSVSLPGSPAAVTFVWKMPDEGGNNGGGGGGGGGDGGGGGGPIVIPELPEDLRGVTNLGILVIVIVVIAVFVSSKNRTARKTWKKKRKAQGPTWDRKRRFD